MTFVMACCVIWCVECDLAAGVAFGKPCRVWNEELHGMWHLVYGI